MIWLNAFATSGNDRRNSSTDAHCALTIGALPRFAARAIWFTLVPILPSS